MRISLEDYFMGRDALYPSECSEEVRGNAAITVAKANSLLAVLEAQGIALEPHPNTASIVSSGWRPPQVNAATTNAAVRSKHMTGEAVDLYDPDGELDEFCLAHPGSLAAIGLWQEHPSATKGWLHLQIVPPRSGKRVFYP